MKTFIILIFIALFLQASFLPVNICLLLLISRSLVSPSKDNLYLAFIAGCFLGVLTTVNLGFYAIVFLIAVQIVLLIRKSPFLGHFLVIVPLTFVMVYALDLTRQQFYNQSFDMTHIWIETILALPVYLFVKFWEERFESLERGAKLKI